MARTLRKLTTLSGTGRQDALRAVIRATYPYLPDELDLTRATHAAHRAEIGSLRELIGDVARHHRLSVEDVVGRLDL
jgi:hypothetical protein